VSTYTLAHEHSFFVELNESTYEGFTESGIKLQRKDFSVSPTWKNTARVITTHPSCTDVKMNDLVVFKKHSTKRLGAIEGELLVLFERQVLGVIRKGNGDVWFQR
jgi:co-chaperonin GroES (HSP10)